MTADVETIVVGAGAVGLAVARALAIAGHEVMVLEQHALIGSETSSRNSEVIHAGLYYPPGSLRAKLCVGGKELLYRFCAENDIGHARCGKLLVATHESQLPKLAAIRETAARNGVTDLVPVDAVEARALEPGLACVAALISPSTGILDSHGYMLALQGHIEAGGGSVVLRCPVERIERTGALLYRLITGGEAPGAITCRRLVLSAGLHASKLGRTLSYGAGYAVPETYYAKGQYYALSGPSPFKRHIYPMPDGAWLGLHATVDIGGRCKFGPDIEWMPEIDYSFEPAKLAKFLDFIRSYYPDLDASRLHPDYTGIRPKLYREGEPVPDFAIHGPETHGLPGMVALYGIESPGLTSSLAIGEMVAGMLVDDAGSS
ncbi:MAG TPA: NAD(P)/FAD-dependent oxidoreductase [Hyphomicrobiaceae bacterium]|nr:NAD(P)/FAD-dependent oxidoreductase [Hyphomicrobiaceae bacterium]